MNTDLVNVLVTILSVGAITALVCVVLRQRRQMHADQKSLSVLSKQLSSHQLKLSHDQKELNAILASMVEGVLVIGADEKILYASPNATAMFELRSEQVKQKNYWEIIPHLEINSAIEEALTQRQVVKKEIIIVGVEDTVFDMHIAPVLTDNVLTSVVAVFHDITQLKRLIKLRSEFVANVSHELKTPLTSIKGYVETLLDDGGLNDQMQVRRFLEKVQHQSQRLQNLVEDLLSLSSLESSGHQLVLQKQELLPIIQAALDVCRQSLHNAGHHLQVQVPVQLPLVLADQDRLEQVLINLLDNAIKFTPAKGQIQVIASVEGNYVRVDVVDSGVGIAPEHLSRVFERFYRVDKARSAALGGTGLGLAIVKHIIQAHQGKVSIQSAPKQGSTFSIFLPFIK